MSRLSIKGILEKLDKLNRSNPLRYMTIAKMYKFFFAAFWSHGLGYISNWVEDTLQQIFE